MAGKSKGAEGIALLSMYNDEEDMDIEDEGVETENGNSSEGEDNKNCEENTPPVNPSQTSQTPPPESGPSARSPAPPTPPLQAMQSSPQVPPNLRSEVLDVQTRKSSLGIVDYAHDETAMSPEPEEGDVMGTGRIMLNDELHVANGYSQERTSPGTIPTSMPIVQATSPQPSDLSDQPKNETSTPMDYPITEPEAAELDKPAAGSPESSKEVDALEKFLPPTPMTKCSEELQVLLKEPFSWADFSGSDCHLHCVENFLLWQIQGVSIEPAIYAAEKAYSFLTDDYHVMNKLVDTCYLVMLEKINKFLAYKRAGKSFNADLRNRKDYRNPDFLLHAVTYQEIDQIGTCFSKDVFDPNGYDPSDYYDRIEADMKREMEKKEQERKKSQKVEFVQGGVQPGAVIPATKVSTQVAVSGVAVAASGLLPAPTDGITREGRQNKKTKWDKVDGDRRIPLHPGTQDNIATTATHSAILSAASVGTGYTAFAQQKRREAEERRSSERKLDKRS